MNEECLKLKDHTAGFQTVEDIQKVVTEAIGGKHALTNEQLIDEVMVSVLLLWPTFLLGSCHNRATLIRLSGLHCQFADDVWHCCRMMMSTTDSMKQSMM